MGIPIDSDADCAQRLRALEAKVVPAQQAVRDAENAQREAQSRRKTLRADLATAFADGDNERVAGIRDELTALDGQFHEERVEGARLALRRAEQNVAKYIGHAYEPLMKAHLPRCHKAVARINQAVENYLSAIQEYGEAARVTVQLVTTAGRGNGRGVPELAQPYTDLRQYLRRLPDVPTPLPSETPPVEAPPSAPDAWKRRIFA